LQTNNNERLESFNVKVFAYLRKSSCEQFLRIPKREISREENREQMLEKIRRARGRILEVSNVCTGTIIVGEQPNPEKKQCWANRF
jgi:hypothetical protein